MSIKPPECYTAEPQAKCLRIHMESGCLLLLPLNQFVYAELTNEGNEQKLHLIFATHEVLIFGHVLRRIEAAVHRLELASLMKLPEKYHDLVEENQPRIRDIVVTESKSAETSNNLN